MDSWTSRVEHYVKQLAELTDRIDALLRQTKIDSTAQDPAKVQACADQLRVGMEALEEKVAEREELLHANDAPPTGFTLVEKLRATSQIDLATLCDDVAARIAEVHQRAISTFVCQYHLAGLTTDLVRLMTGGDQPATYGTADSQPPTPQGGLFNEAG